MTAAAVHALAPDPLQHGWWLASRSAGVVALALVTASTLLGLTMAARLLRGRRGLGPQLAKVHEQLSVTGIVAIAVHGVTLLGDAWLRPGLAGIVVPGVMSYRPLFTSLGILAGWLTALLGLSFYARRRIGARRWRSLHRFTALAYALAVVHTLGAGTDAPSAWLRLPLLGSAALALVLLAVRFVRRRPVPRSSTGAISDARPTTRSPAPSARRSRSAAPTAS
jgi:methionine sulfoxide reductase heme-binding subunit